MDGRDFIVHSLLLLNIKSMDGKEKTPIKTRAFTHYIMNLPASAPDFLDSFSKIKGSEDLEDFSPLIHCYLFTKLGEDPSSVSTSQKYLSSDYNIQLI